VAGRRRWSQGEVVVSASQSAADLRTLVARRVGLKRKVVLLGSDPTLVRTLEANGCEVLADPPSLLEVSAFAPQAIVAFDGFAHEGSGAENFATLVTAAPDAEIVFSFANAASASALLQGLVGHAPPPALAEPDVRGWLQSAGLQIVSRDVVIGPHQSTGLAVDAEAQLRQLLEQLNPDAGAERLLIVARRVAIGSSEIPREPGLLTVLVSATDALSALQGTLGSLAAQPQRPLQVVIATSGPVDEAERMARLQAERGAFAAEVLAVPSADFAVRTNQALARARGQYVAFLEAGDTLEKHHFRQLLRSLEQGTSAWAVARLKQPGVAALESGFSLPTWLAAGATARCSLLLDRDRLGPFPLTFAEGVAEAEPLFLARLAALFPVITANGAASVERPTLRAPFDPNALARAMQARPLRAISPLQLAHEEGWGDRLERDVSRRLPGLGTQLQRWLKPR
jgi:hypothetical protein